MVVPGRHRSIAFFIALGVGLISVVILLYIGWVLLNWRTGILFFFGFLLTAMVVSGVILNTTFLVREIRRNEQHDAFINAVTHELKTPVASIRLYLETLQTRAVPEEKRQEFYRVMLEDSERLFSTIEQVLRTGRVGSSQRLLAFSTINLSDVVDSAVSRARSQYNLQNVSLELQACPSIMVQGDEDELRAAVSNLIDNAVKYSSGSAQIFVSLHTEDRNVSVVVRDQGIGIPRSELKRIFKRFYRVNSATKRIKGTGLGLFIVRSVAKRHGGRAWAESDGMGRGSTFVFQLPIAK